MLPVDDILYSTSISCDCKKLSQTKRSFSLSLPPPPLPLCTEMQLATDKVVKYRGQHTSTNQQTASI